MRRIWKISKGTLLIVASVFMIASLFSCGKKNTGKGNKKGVEQAGDATLTLKELKYKNGGPLVAPYKVQVDHHIEKVEASDFTAKFDYASEKDKQIDFDEVALPSGQTKLQEGANTITLKVKASTGFYKEFSVPVIVERLEKAKSKKQVTFVASAENVADITAEKKVGQAAPVKFNSGDGVEEGAVITFTCKIKDTKRFAFKEWVGAKQDATNPLVATVTVGKENIAVKANFDRKGNALTFAVFSVSPEGQGTLNVLDGGQNVLKSGDKVVEGDDVTFSLTIKETASYEVDKWEGATKDENTPTRATLKMPATATTVTVKLKEVVGKTALIKTLKLMNGTTVAQEIHESEILAAKGSEGHVIELDYEKCSGVALKFAMTTSPADAAVVYAEPQGFNSEAATFNDEFKVVKIKVKKVGKGSDAKPEYAETAYAFKFRCKQELKLTKLKLGGTTVSKEDIEDAKVSGTDTEGKLITLTKDQAAFKFDVGVYPTTAKYVVFEIKTPKNTDYKEFDGNTVTKDLDFTPDTTEKKVGIDVFKTGGKTVHYIFRIKKAPEVTPKHELKTLKIGGEDVSENDFNDFKSGQTDWNLKSLDDQKIKWTSDAGKVTIKIGTGTAQDKGASDEYELTGAAKVTEDSTGTEVEIVVYENADKTGKKTTYLFKIMPPEPAEPQGP